jgi:hypothetical protein
MQIVPQNTVSFTSQYKGCIITLATWFGLLLLTGSILFITSLLFYRTIVSGALRTTLPMWMNIIDNDVSSEDRMRFSNTYLHACHSIESASFKSIASYTSLFVDVQDQLLTQEEVKDFISHAESLEK